MYENGLFIIYNFSDACVHKVRKDNFSFQGICMYGKNI